MSPTSLIRPFSLHLLMLSGCTLIAPFDSDELPLAPDGGTDAGWLGDGDCTLPMGIIEAPIEADDDCILPGSKAHRSVTLSEDCRFDTGRCNDFCGVEGVDLCVVDFEGATLSDEVCIVVFESLEVAEGVRLELVGDRGLVMISTEQTLIDGQIDAGAQGQVPGPGGAPGGERGEGGKAPSYVAAVGVTAQAPSAPEGDGGGGGAYHASGGDGGCGDGAGGTLDSNCYTPFIVAGSGGAGGSLSEACQEEGGAGGAGGGLLMLFSYDRMTIGATGELRVDGGAGQSAGCDFGGGGGGGSGGALIIEATWLDIQGRITTLGGEGGASGTAAGGAGGGLNGELSGARGQCETAEDGRGGGGGGGGAGLQLFKAMHLRFGDEAILHPRQPQCIERFGSC